MLMQLNVPLLIGGCVGAVIVMAIVLEAVVRANRAKKRKSKDTGIVLEGKVRFSQEAESFKHDESPNASFVKGDVVLPKGKILTVGKKGDLISGKYTILTSNEEVHSFNIRVNTFVTEHKHNTSLVLGEGDTICAVSHTIILR